jgi:NADPH:quinone reductase-like Zn-dependent oxidoreductase
MRLPLTEPHVLGGDVAGDVVEVGAEVAQLAHGDRVVIYPRITCRQCRYCVSGDEEMCLSSYMLGDAVDGGYAEYICVPAANAVPIVDSVSYEEAASLPTVFVPCWNMLIRRANLKPWDTVLVLSASSGVGTAAIQVAKYVVGARVIATTSTDEKATKAIKLGADEVIIYTKDDIVERVAELTENKGVDVVVDHVGADFWKPAISSLAPGGKYGICGVTTGYKAELQMGQLFLRQQTIFGVLMGRCQDLVQIVDMTARGIINGVVHETFELRDAARAHEVLERADFFGKLVLIVP